MTRLGYLAQYRTVRAVDDVPDPHRIVTLLLAGVIESVRRAGACMAQGDVAGKHEAISRGLNILDGLRLSLDHEAGGEIAGGLESLYEYASMRLVEANAGDQRAPLDEVAGLLGEIESAWQAIPHG